MKKVLIISPYFPPSNTADMQRVRMSLPYFKKFGWEAEVVTVLEKHSDLSKDKLLLENIPSNIVIHQVDAFSKKFTSKFGLGSLGLRSMYSYRKHVNKLLKAKHYDLIYFSTTEFSVMILGAYWKKKYNVPYAIDMQDPWHSTYYENRPKSERPAKYWFSYRLNKFLEPIAMKNLDGLISVSQAYINTLQNRYKNLKSIPTKVITFGAYAPDFEFVKSNVNLFNLPFSKTKDSINIVYVGRGGHDLKISVSLLFEGFKKGLAENPVIFNRLRFHFIGTSYARNGTGKPTIKPIADEMGLSEFVFEQTDRVSFYNSIFSLLNAEALIIVGSDDPQYTASKIYPYILADKPLMAIFHPLSSASKIINECGAGRVISVLDKKNAINFIYDELAKWLSNYKKSSTNWAAFSKYDAKNMTKLQCDLFNQTIN
ncbi:glycosyltransferase [Pedobacter namyangjuensis]|uniref:glycosyltransferase n=1 Tax=Pedobacter namyangjuensis TaxID=600626 RepID=UPI000DE381FC|nr:glycosyltransferase [Pedobacter namyangjuensis]